MEYVNQTNYEPKLGRKFRKRSKVQLAEYQPLQKMLANLTIAGLNASARQALEFYDGNVDQEIDIPILPRHITPDINEVHQVAKHFARQKQEIENRVFEARQKHLQELRAARKAQAASNPPSGAPGSGGGVSAPAAP